MKVRVISARPNIFKMFPRMHPVSWVVVGKWNERAITLIVDTEEKPETGSYLIVGAENMLLGAPTEPPEVAV